MSRPQERQESSPDLENPSAGNLQGLIAFPDCEPPSAAFDFFLPFPTKENPKKEGKTAKRQSDEILPDHP